MSAAVVILDALRKKPVAEKKTEFSVAFFVANAVRAKRIDDKEVKNDKNSAFLVSSGGVV